MVTIFGGIILPPRSAHRRVNLTGCSLVLLMIFSILSLSHFSPGTCPEWPRAISHKLYLKGENKFQHVTCSIDGTDSVFGLARMSESSQTTKVLLPNYRGFLREVNLSFLKWAEASTGSRKF